MRLRDGLPQRPVGVVQLRGAVEREVALKGLRSDEIVRVELPAQLMKALLELGVVHMQLARQAEKRLGSEQGILGRRG